MWIGVQWRLHELKPLVVHVYCPLGQSSVLFLSSEKTSESTISSSPPDDEKQIDLVLRMSSRVCTNFIPDHFGITITPVFPSLKTSLLEYSSSSNILPLAFLPPHHHSWNVSYLFAPVGPELGQFPVQRSFPEKVSLRLFLDMVRLRDGLSDNGPSERWRFSGPP